MVVIEDVELYEVDVRHCAIAIFQLEIETLTAWVATLLPSSSIGEMLRICLEITDDLCAKAVGQTDAYVVGIGRSPSVSILNGAVADGEPLGGDGLRVGVVVIGRVNVGVVVGIGVERLVQLIDADLESLKGIAHKIIDEESEVKACAGVVEHRGLDSESFIAVELCHEVAHDGGVGLRVGETSQIGLGGSSQHGVAYSIGFCGDIIHLIVLGDEVL